MNFDMFLQGLGYTAGAFSVIAILFSAWTIFRAHGRGEG